MIPINPNKYSRGKIYKIISPHTDMIYIGSTTCETLAQRLGEHKKYRKQYIEGTVVHVPTSKEILDLGPGDASIILLETYPCDNRDQLRAREQFHIDANPNCANKNRAYRSAEVKETCYREWYESHRADRLVKMKQYREKNRNQILQCRKEWREKNKEKVQRKCKNNYANNRAEILEKQKKRDVCECGVEIRKLSLARHRRTQKHIDWMAKQAPVQPELPVLTLEDCAAIWTFIESL